MSKRSKTELIGLIGDRVRAMHVATDLFDELAAESLGINRTDHRVLDVLEREGPMTPSRLAELNHLSRPAMTTVIDRLEHAGYARRARSADDRREVRVEVTELARERGMAIYAPFATHSQEAFGDYTQAELELILDFLERSIELSSRMLESTREGLTSQAQPRERDDASSAPDEGSAR